MTTVQRGGTVVPARTANAPDRDLPDGPLRYFVDSGSNGFRWPKSGMIPAVRRPSKAHFLALNTSLPR